MLTQKEQEFIQRHLQADTTRLILNQKKYLDLDIKKLATQINIRRKAVSKIPTWAKSPAVFFPSTISWQQCSSELTARYKATVFKNISVGNTITDLTGGFGVDAFYFSKQFEKVIYIERQTELTEIVTYNNKVFNQTNIQIVNDDSLELLKTIEVDCIYLDPARRNERQQKVITLEDSTPNVIEIQDELLAKANYIMVKTSPMLDIHKALRGLKSVEEIHVVAVENECKELLFIMSNNVDTTHKVKLTCVNISKNDTIDKFETTWNNYTSISYSQPKRYLYDANKAILKGNIINAVGKRFGFEKIAPNTQLLTSNELREDFQGRIFEVKTVVKPSKKAIAKYLENGKANLIVRNFPESVSNLRKKWKIKDGGNVYLFVVTLANAQKVVVFCKRLD